VWDRGKINGLGGELPQRRVMVARYRAAGRGRGIVDCAVF
jgi:hypothetical protein